MEGSSKTCAEFIGTSPGKTCNCSMPFSLNEDYRVCYTLLLLVVV